MTRTLCISLILLLLGAAGAGTAHAGGYVNGPFQTVAGSCPIIGQVDNTYSLAGYYADQATSLPRTGDVAYVHGLTANIGCVNDASSMVFFLPVGTQFAISGINPVICKRVKPGTPVIEEYLPAAECSQTPIPQANGGSLFAVSQLAPGWYFEVLVPVVYQHELLGAAGGSTHALKIAVTTSFGAVTVSVPVNAGYRPQLLNATASAITSTTASFDVTLYNYFKGGTFALDYGTTAALGQSESGAVGANAVYYTPNVGLLGLVPNTQYYWRTRFVASNGATVVTPTQSFVTSPPAPVTLTVSVGGNGAGWVTSVPAGIYCGPGTSNVCSISVTPGTIVRLTATTSFPYWFAGWSGACISLGACEVTVNAAASVTATFNFWNPQPLPGPIPPPRGR